MSISFAAPDAADAILTLAESIPDIDRADGPLFKSTLAKALVVGAPDQPSGGIEHQLDGIGYSVDQDDRFTVYCWADVKVEATVSQARREAYGVLAALAELIYGDPTLGGAVEQAEISDVDYLTVMTEDRGYLARVRFGVTCESQTLTPGSTGA